MKQNKSHNKLKNISYISIPENLATTINNFEIDPKILLPIEIQAGNSMEALKNLSWEMIISACLKVLAYDPFSKDADYYRNFIIAIKPDIIEELTQAGIIKAQNQDFELAEEIFLSIANLKETESTVLNLALVYEEHALAYERVGNDELNNKYLKKAEEAYSRFKNFETVSDKVLYNLAYFKVKTGQLNQAKQLLQNFIDNSKDKEKIARVKKSLELLKNEEENESLFKEAFDDINSGNELEGIEKMKSYLKSNTATWNAWFLMAWAYRRIKEYEKAKDGFLKALELQKDFPDIYNELSICYMELKNFEKSETYLNKALEIAPENIKILSNLGILEVKKKNFEKAKSYFEKILTIEKDDEIAINYLNMINNR